MEIEEFYDTAGSGGVGLQSGPDGGFNLGVNGNGRKITKRVYRFKGVIGSEIEGKDIVVEQELSETPAE